MAKIAHNASDTEVSQGKLHDDIACCKLELRVDEHLSLLQKTLDITSCACILIQHDKRHFFQNGKRLLLTGIFQKVSSCHKNIFNFTHRHQVDALPLFQRTGYDSKIDLFLF